MCAGSTPPDQHSTEIVHAFPTRMDARAVFREDIYEMLSDGNRIRVTCNASSMQHDGGLGPAEVAARVILAGISGVHTDCAATYLMLSSHGMQRMAVKCSWGSRQLSCKDNK